MIESRTTRSEGRTLSRPVLLVVGFGAFEHYSENPAGDVAEAVHRRRLGGVRIVGRRIPVSWREAWDCIRGSVQEHRPEALLCLGVAPDPFIRLEVLAKNASRPCLDVHGERPETGALLRIVEDAPPAYWTTLPLERLHERLWQRGRRLKTQDEAGLFVVSDLWTDAGWYLCNHVFFQIMHYLGRSVPHRGFIHVPRYPLPGEEMHPSPEEVQAAGVFLVEELARWLSKESAV